MTISRISRNGKHAANGIVGSGRNSLVSAPAEVAPGETAEKGWLTPALAKQFLCNIRQDQRGVRGSHLSTLKEDIIAGRWKYNGQPILIDANGDLADGRHRCEAVIQTGIAIEVLIVRGVPVSSFSSMDGGAKRSGADAIRCLFPTNPLVASGALRLWLYYTLGRSLNRGWSVSPQGIYEIGAQNPGIERSVIFCKGAIARKGFFGSGMVFCHYAFSLLNQKDADTFVGQIIHGESIKKGDPAFAVRDKLISGEKFSTPEFIHGCFRAWMYFRRNKQLQMLRIMPVGSPLPEIS